MKKQVYFFVIIVFFTLLIFGCTENETEKNTINPGNELEEIEDQNKYSEEKPVEDKESDDFLSESEFVDCETVDIGKINSFEDYKANIPCYLERAIDCKKTKITVKAESNFGEEIISYEVLGGDTSECNYSQTNEKSKDLFGDFSGKSIECNLDSETYINNFPSNNSYLYKCTGSLVESLKELYDIETDEKFQFLKSSEYVYAKDDVYHLLMQPDGEVGLMLYTQIFSGKGSSITQLKEIAESETDKSQLKCGIVDNSGWLFGGDVMKCNYIKENRAMQHYYLLKNNEYFQILIFSKNDELPEESVSEFEKYIKANINFN